jgi:hypothetical protein
VKRHLLAAAARASLTADFIEGLERIPGRSIARRKPKLP